MVESTVQKSPASLPVEALRKQAQPFKVSGLVLLILAAPLTNVLLFALLSLIVLNANCELARLVGVVVEGFLEGKRWERNSQWLWVTGATLPPLMLLVFLGVGLFRLWPAARWLTAVVTALAGGGLIGLSLFIVTRSLPAFSEGASFGSTETQIVFACLVGALALLGLHLLNVRVAVDRLFSKSARRALRSDARDRRARRSSLARIGVITCILFLIALHVALPCLVIGLGPDFLDAKNYRPPGTLGRRVDSHRPSMLLSHRGRTLSGVMASPRLVRPEHSLT